MHLPCSIPIMSNELRKTFLKYSLPSLCKDNYLWRMLCLEVVGEMTNGANGGLSWDSARSACCQDTSGKLKD